MDRSQVLQESLQQLNSYIRTEMNLPADEDVFQPGAAGISDDSTVKLVDRQHPESGYIAYVQPWAPQKDINTLIAQLKSMPSNAILLANFVNPVMAEKFRRRSIAFADCAGNLSLKSPTYNFYVKGKKRPALQTRRVRGRAFNAAGLKLIFAIFNQPQLLSASYREIANKVGIALGSVGPVMDDLYSSGYVLDDGQRRLVNKKRLFERWVDGYLEKLRPKQLLACYRSEQDDWWKRAEPEAFSGLWGGDVSIAKATPFMVPETCSLYFFSDKQQQAFADAHGLISDDDGDVCVYKAFWSPLLLADDTGTISPMVMYADIVDSINPGSWDVAKTFYGEAVAHLLAD